MNATKAKKFFIENIFILPRIKEYGLGKETTTYACSNSSDASFYWADINKSWFEKNWALILDDKRSRVCRLLIVPAGKMLDEKDKIYYRTDKGQYEIKIKYDDDTYCDNYKGCSFGEFYVGYIAYDENDDFLEWMPDEEPRFERPGGEEIALGGMNRFKGENVLFYGVPGAGKSHAVEKYLESQTGQTDCPNSERVVFHPDYSYSDFVGQILPKLLDDGKDDGEKRLSYEFMPGPFTRMLREAVNDPGSMYYLVIEEINRGNAPAIFGDVFQLLDRKEDGEGKYSITNYDIDKYINEDGHGKRIHDNEIRIPSNLSILATMNTSDQNVFTLDTAFQRRWNMKLIKNDVMHATYSNVPIDGSRITWGAFASVVNKKVIAANEGMLSSEDKRLGAYFVQREELSKDRFPEKVLKYLWDDAFKDDRYLIFRERLSTLEDVIAEYEETNDEADPLESVLDGKVYQEMVDAAQGMRKQG